MFEVKRAVILPMMVAAIAACQPAIAQAIAQLANFQEPGSVLVFPMFQTGPGVTTFTISVTCPTGVICLLHQRFNLKAEWVCPAIPIGSPTACATRDFALSTSVTGTLTFTPGTGGAIPPPPCNQGYLLVWVIDILENAIKFDGLVGKAVIRQFPQSDTAYNAIPIQAGDGFKTGDIISPDTIFGTALPFDGTHYKAVTGQVTGNVAYPTPIPFVGAGPFNTYLVFLTLDVISRRPDNNITFVDLDFYNEGELVVNAAAAFTCWGIMSLRDLGPTTNFGINGLVQSNQATSLDRPVTLLGLTLTQEVVGGAFTHNIVPLLNNSVGIPTTFVTQ
jgi:hypothetical protein